MKKWLDEDGIEFENDTTCFGREYNPGSGTVDVAKISIRGEYPAPGVFGYLEESHEMAVVIRGQGFIETMETGRTELVQGDVVYISAQERFRWGGDMDLIVPCGPAFDPSKHKFEEVA